MGRARVNWAGWVEFGGTRHRPVESTRDFVRDGRFLFPAARGLAGRSAELYAAAVQRGFNTFDWTNPGTVAGQVHD